MIQFTLLTDLFKEKMTECFSKLVYNYNIDLDIINVFTFVIFPKKDLFFRASS